jgi:N-acetylmuramoyl-L-alanine amidase
MKRTLFASLLLVFLFGYSEASKGVTVEGYQYWSNETYTRVSVDLSDDIEFTQHRLSNPDRIYFDLKKCILSSKVAPSLQIEDGILKKIRISQFNNETVRVVLDLQELEDFKVFIMENPYRLIIDAFGKKKSGEPVPYKKLEKEITRIRKVVIDPGHGGEDPGAVGYSGLLEKDVVLSVGKELAGILKEKYDMEVILTRSKDVFIPLHERTAIANSSKADLFISIHANASRRKAARGIETYILNWTTDEESMRVAARENNLSLEKMKEVQSELQMILDDLERDNKKEESRKLAYNVQNLMISSLSRDYKQVIDLGVKQALFYVLVRAEMPSVLVEISFISNRDEERLLSQKKYIDKIAEAIANGVGSYITPPKLVKKTSDNI